MGFASNKLGNNGGRSYSFLSKPVRIDLNFKVNSTDSAGYGITNLKGAGVQAVYMNTSATPAAGNPNPAAGYAIIQLANNYNRYCGSFSGMSAPTTGSNLAINASALTVGNPYIITAVGTGPSGAVTIAPVADVSGSLASTYFTLPDAYGNVWTFYFIVNGVGQPPNILGDTLVPINLATNASATTITTALSTAILGLLASQGAGNATAPAVAPFTTSGAGTSTLTVTSVVAAPLPGGCQDGVPATGFTFAVTANQTNLQKWQAVGLPKGVNPAVGVAFICTAVGSSTLGSSSGTVAAVGTSAILSTQVVGDPNLSFAPIPMGGSPNVGGYVILQFMNDSDTVTAPANGTLVSLSFDVEAGSILIQGE